VLAVIGEEARRAELVDVTRAELRRALRELDR
jgi:hypothetical protein